MKHFFRRVLLFLPILPILFFVLSVPKTFADSVQIDPSQVVLGQKSHLTILLSNATAVHTLSIANPTNTQSYFNLSIRTDFNKPCQNPGASGPFSPAKACQSGVYYIDIDTNKLGFNQSAKSYTYSIALDGSKRGTLTVNNPGKYDSGSVPILPNAVLTWMHSLSVHLAQRGGGGVGVGFAASD